MVLQDLIARQPGRRGEVPCPLDPPGPVVARAEQADRALGHQLAERLDGLLQRHRRVLDVGVQQVEPVHPQAFAAAFGGLPDDHRRQPFDLAAEGGGRSGRPAAELGGDDDLVADPAVAAPAAEQRLALSALRAVHPVGVVVGGVDERAAGFDVPVQDRERGRLVDLRAEKHGAQAQHADLATRRGTQADRAVTHVFPPVRPATHGHCEGVWILESPLGQACGEVAEAIALELAAGRLRQ